MREPGTLIRIHFGKIHIGKIDFGKIHFGKIQYIVCGKIEIQKLLVIVFRKYIPWSHGRSVPVQRQSGNMKVSPVYGGYIPVPGSYIPVHEGYIRRI